MARRLTTFSKLLITLLILAALFFLFRYLMNNTEFGKNLRQQSKTESVQSGDQSSGGSTVAGGGAELTGPDVLRVQLVTWGGYGPGVYFNEGAIPSTRSRYYKDYGLKVKFEVNDDLGAALNAWMAGEYDILVQTADAFPLYTGPADIAQYKPKAFMQVDWSRGGDAIIAKRGINSINDLKGKRVAVAVPSPAQTLLLTALEAAGLKYSDVTTIETSDNFKSADIFKGPDVDAAVVWAPYDEVLRSIPGAKVLITTQSQSNIIGDIMFAKEDFIRANQDKINAFYEGWMRGVSEVMADEGNYNKAAKLLGELINFSTEDAAGAMSLVRFATHGDNVNFFGLNPDFRGQKGGDIYDKMNGEFVKMKVLEGQAPTWRSVINTVAIQSASSKLTGPQHAAESTPKFTPATKAEESAEAVASKPVSINFATGQFALTENAKTIIDLQFAEIAKTFAQSRIRIEGNTDNVGSRETNMELSRKRAQAVADYLKNTYSLDPNRFIIIGNGPDNPVPGCESNATAECKAKNRRTDFQIIATN